MNISKWSNGKKLLAVLAVILVIIGVAATIFIVQKRQETRTQAQKSTTLSLTPATQSVSPGDDATLDINIDPGQNQVNLVKVTLKFDANRFSATANDFTLDPDSELEIINGPVVGAGSFAVVLSTGSDPTQVIRSAQKIGTLVLTTADGAETGSSDVTFEYAQTEVRSIEAGDAYNENVLSSAVPATITVEAVCKPNVATCSWDELTGASVYRYKITNVTDDEVVSEDTTANTSVEFPSIPGKTYKCEVSAENQCGGVGEAEEAENTCVLPSETPTPTQEVSGTPTPTLSSTPTPTRNLSHTPTPTSSITNTPTPTIVLTSTPTLTPTNSPTPTLTVTLTHTPTPTSVMTSTPTPTVPEGSTPTPTSEVTASPTPAEFTEATPTPSLPPTGIPMVLGGLIGGILIILGGVLLLFL